MTRIIIPYTKYLPIQAQHLYMDNCDPEYVDVSGSPDLYYEVMKELWSLKEDFILIEHDIIPWPGALKTYDECPEIWCAHQYLYPPDGHLVIAHGCVRYRKQVMEEIPDMFVILEDWGSLPGNPPNYKDWKTLDGRMGAVLTQKLSAFVHVHKPPVVHLKEAIAGELVREELDGEETL